MKSLQSYNFPVCKFWGKPLPLNSHFFNQVDSGSSTTLPCVDMKIGRTCRLNKARQSSFAKQTCHGSLLLCKSRKSRGSLGITLSSPPLGDIKQRTYPWRSNDLTKTSSVGPRLWMEMMIYYIKVTVDGTAFTYWYVLIYLSLVLTYIHPGFWRLYRVYLRQGKPLWHFK